MRYVIMVILSFIIGYILGGLCKSKSNSSDDKYGMTWRHAPRQQPSKRPEPIKKK